MARKRQRAAKAKQSHATSDGPATPLVDALEARLQRLHVQPQSDSSSPSTSSSIQSQYHVVYQWNGYFRKGTLDDWQRLCADLGLDDDLPSKRKCRKVERGP
jgi:hypothetical protein